MTIENHSKPKSGMLATALIFFFAIFASSCLSPQINQFTKSGLLICFSVVIGSVFPFMILTDIISSKARFESISTLRGIFERFFKINGAAVSAFVAGAVCGFPLGVKVALDLYKSGIISRDECERLIGFSNNTGPAFVISGIGVALFNSHVYGIIIYISMLLSAIFVGFIFGFGRHPSKNEKEKEKPKFEFTASLRSGVVNTLSICGFVVIFSVIYGLLTLFIKNRFLLVLMSGFIEVSNASKAIASAVFLTPDIRLALAAFAVSFSGISVHLQAKCFTYNTDISMKKYYKMKLLQGVLAFVFTFIITKSL